MGRLLTALAVSFAALVAFAVVVRGMPLADALGAVLGAVAMIAVLLAHLWARERREARG